MQTTSQESNLELVGQLFEQHADTVYRYCRLRMEAEDAHDAVSEAFVVALRRAQDIPEAPIAWLLAVARRVVANQLRRQRRAGALVHKLGLGLGFGGAPDVAESVMASDAAYRVLAKLRPSDREVLLMALAAPLTGAELGLALGCSAKTAGVRLSRARSRLNQAVAELEAPTKVSDDTFVGVPTVPSGRVCARGSLAPTVSTRTEPVVQQVPRPDRSSSPVPMTTANVRSTP